MSNHLKDVTIEKMEINKEYRCNKGEEPWFLTTALDIDFKDIVLYSTPRASTMAFSTDKWPGVEEKVYFALEQLRDHNVVTRLTEESFNSLTKYMVRDTLRPTGISLVRKNQDH